MAYPPNKFMGGEIHEDCYRGEWTWHCGSCGDCISFPLQMHPRHGSAGAAAVSHIEAHDKRCSRQLQKYQRMSNLQQQMEHQQQMAQQRALMMQQAYLQSPPQILNNNVLGVQNGNWGTTQTSPSSANSLTSNTLKGAIAAIRASDERAYRDTRKPLERASTTFGEIVGWRMWTVRRGYLYAYSRDELWVPKEPMVGKPDDYNDMGIWAFKERKRAILKMLNDRCHSERMTVCGSVMLYGTVIEHKEGYRAEYGMIKSLDDICGANADNDDPKEQLKIRKQFDKLKEKYLANSAA